MPSDEEISAAVDIFLDEALGDSWRDQALGRLAESAPPTANQVGRPVDPERTFEPPLARLWCNRCKNNWDAWVGEDGLMEDPRDSKCSCGGTVFLTADE